MWQIYLNYHQRMGILPPKKSVNHNKYSFAKKQRMFGVFAIHEPCSQARVLYATLAQFNFWFFEGGLRIELKVIMEEGVVGLLTLVLHRTNIN